MKRVACIMVCAAVVFYSGAVFAVDTEQKSGESQQRPQQMPVMGRGMMGGAGMGAPMMGRGMAAKSGMGKGVMEKKMVATSDGGVVVCIGSKLIKYDRNLKKVAEAEIGTPAMGYWQMMGECPMMPEEEMQEEVDPHTIDPYHHPPKKQ